MLNVEHVHQSKERTSVYLEKVQEDYNYCHGNTWVNLILWPMVVVHFQIIPP